MPDVDEPLAVVLEESRACYSILLPGQLFGKPGERIGLAFILHRLLTTKGRNTQDIYAIVACFFERLYAIFACYLSLVQ